MQGNRSRPGGDVSEQDTGKTRAQRVKIIMRSRGIPMRTLADRLGVTIATVSRKLSWKISITDDEWLVISEMLEMSIEDIDAWDGQYIDGATQLLHIILETTLLAELMAACDVQGYLVPEGPGVHVGSDQVVTTYPLIIGFMRFMLIGPPGQDIAPLEELLNGLIAIRNL